MTAATPTVGGLGIVDEQHDEVLEEASRCSSVSRSSVSSSVSLASLSSAVMGESSTAPMRPPPPPQQRPITRIQVQTSLEDELRRQAEEEKRTRRTKAQRERREREQAQKAAIDSFVLLMDQRRLNTYQILLVEHVLLPQNIGLPNGRLRLDFLQLTRSGIRRRGGCTNPELIDPWPPTCGPGLLSSPLAVL